MDCSMSPMDCSMSPMDCCHQCTVQCHQWTAVTNGLFNVTNGLLSPMDCSMSPMDCCHQWTVQCHQCTAVTNGLFNVTNGLLVVCSLTVECRRPSGGLQSGEIRPKILVFRSRENLAMDKEADCFVYPLCTVYPSDVWGVRHIDCNAHMHCWRVELRLML